MLTCIRTVATCPVLGLSSPLDDVRHQHHRLLLLHHLARLPARSTFTRHRGPIYFADLFTHTHTTPPPPRGTTPPRGSTLSFLFRRYPRPVRTASSRERSPAFHLVLPSLARVKLLLLVSIWYGCSLHFFGSFVIDRATGCLTILQQKEKSGFQEQERDNDGREPTKNPSPNRTATLNLTAFTRQVAHDSLLVKGLR